ncbi:P-loop containing nucleoside triphosphate hydrolase protein [Lineolata rhizophorae]|uniref:P-loop containing nucleoside triphosphate hydrolase protein n=1 Tax=Lineolata rhizophorae TaxID=578093 RepID=A0A6A6PCT6_9PEZI|nr:P-loop containing nucleoside triphosphate hydrolase protein [Lineolata rhizophorae]
MVVDLILAILHVTHLFDAYIALATLPVCIAYAMVETMFLGWSYKRLTSALVNAERVLELVKSKPSASNSKDAAQLQVCNGRIEFHDVDFSYPSREHVINEVSFVANPGQTVAIVGDLRENLGTVRQESVLFNMTVLENIRYARLDATDDEVYDVFSCWTRRRKTFGWRTTASSQCARASQKSKDQLDEPTSAVDSSIEAQTQEALQRLKAGRTIFIA